MTADELETQTTGWLGDQVEYWKRRTRTADAELAEAREQRDDNWAAFRRMCKAGEIAEGHMDLMTQMRDAERQRAEQAEAELAEAKRVIAAQPKPSAVEELRETIAEILDNSDETAVDAFLYFAAAEVARIAGGEMTARWQAEDELVETRAAIERLTVERVRAEHFACRPYRCGDEASGMDGKERCHGCRRVWPCPTIAALDASSAPESQETTDGHA